MLLAASVFAVILNLKSALSFRLNNSPLSRTQSFHMSTGDYALLFDCDGVIVETEELHRIAYNAAFEKFGLILDDGKPVEWDTKYYDILQNTVGGGKPKMFYYFNNDAKCWPTLTKPYKRAPTTDEEKKELVDILQDAKTEFYTTIIEDKAEAREGVLELMDEAIQRPGIKVGICSAATRAGFDKLVNSIVGMDRLSKLDIVVAGDDVSAKKPDPMIYNLASQRLGVPPDRCIVIEDSIVGLKAAKAANMKCVITYTESTMKEDFYGKGADAKIHSLKGITLDDLFTPLMAGEAEVLAKQRDPKESSAFHISSPSEGFVEMTADKSMVAAEFHKGWTPHMMIVPNNPYTRTLAELLKSD